MRKIKKLLCKWFPRYKLRCILRALELDARPWQIEYALGRSKALPEGRCTGKTVAVMLRALMHDPRKEPSLERIIRRDPDYKSDDFKRLCLYRHDYDRYSRICAQAGVPVPLTLFWAHGGSSVLWAVEEARL